MSTTPPKYDDLQAHLAKLKDYGLLHTIDIPVNKDRNLHPLVRWSYVSQLESRERKGFYFTNVTDSNGVSYKGNCDVCVATTAGNEQIYAVSMGLDAPFDVRNPEIDIPALSHATAIYDEKTGEVRYPKGFPVADDAIPDFSAKDLSEF